MSPVVVHMSSVTPSIPEELAVSGNQNESKTGVAVTRPSGSVMRDRESPVSKSGGMGRNVVSPSSRVVMKKFGLVVDAVTVNGRKEISPSGSTVRRNPVGSGVGAGRIIDMYEVSPSGKIVAETPGTAESNGAGTKGMNVVSPSGEMLCVKNCCEDVDVKDGAGRYVTLPLARVLVRNVVSTDVEGETVTGRKVVLPLLKTLGEYVVLGPLAEAVTGGIEIPLPGRADTVWLTSLGLRRDLVLAKVLESPLDAVTRDLLEDSPVPLLTPELNVGSETEPGAVVSAELEAWEELVFHMPVVN